MRTEFWIRPYRFQVENLEEQSEAAIDLLRCEAEQVRHGLVGHGGDCGTPSRPRYKGTAQQHSQRSIVFWR